jgi:alpha-tubulin suppressor-like RCC1 family protein
LGGNNEQAQFGNGKRNVDETSRVPVRVSDVANAVALSGAMVGRHFLAFLRDGTLRVWGNSDWGQTGNHSLAIKQDGSLWIWGVGSSYRGVWPLTQNAPFPVQLVIPDGIVKR